jgi:hypothetical protein
MSYVEELERRIEELERLTNVESVVEAAQLFRMQYENAERIVSRCHSCNFSMKFRNDLLGVDIILYRDPVVRYSVGWSSFKDENTYLDEMYSTKKYIQGG